MDAPTVMALGTREGEYPQASRFDVWVSPPLFPAATTTTMPSAMARLMAESKSALAVPPRLRFITAGVVPV
ncbi:unannotated protein [freshwater metagenome]|uniref:Unannotated protein n=1 Tax=freshwater metagenome TaxID=449393 RepID=A0A6J6EXI0_9ZZZZ